MDAVTGLAGAALAGLAGAFIGAYTQRSVARWQIEADNAKVRSAAYRDFLRLATPQRIQRTMAATVFNAVGNELQDQPAVEAWRKDFDASVADLLVVTPEAVHIALSTFVETVTNEQLRIDNFVRGCLHDGMGDWASQHEGMDAVREERWKASYETLVASIRSDVAA